MYILYITIETHSPLINGAYFEFLYQPTQSVLSANTLPYKNQPLLMYDQRNFHISHEVFE